MASRSPRPSTTLPVIQERVEISPPVEREKKVQCRVSVLGACSAQLPPGEQGVGKSSLCTRFVLPDADTWNEIGHDHSHWLSGSDFQEPEINNQHFVYFGAANRQWTARTRRRQGQRKAHRDSTVFDLEIHVVEHTWFVDDSVQRPFAGGENYSKRATQEKLTSPGKCSYTSRSLLGEDVSLYHAPDGAYKQKLPLEYGGVTSPKTGKKKAGVDGYMFVLDPTKSAEDRGQQWQIMEECWNNLPPKKKDSFVIVLTKCEMIRQALLDKLLNLVAFFNGADSEQSQKRKAKAAFLDCPRRLAVRCGRHTIPIFFTSADQAHGVDTPFIYLAHRSQNLPGHPPRPESWSRVTQASSDLDAHHLLSAHRYFDRHLTSYTTEWSDMHAIFQDRDMNACRVAQGTEVCRSLFKSHLLPLVIAAAEALLQEELDRERVFGTRTGSAPLDAGMRATRLRSYVARLSKKHPDLQDLIKKSEDGQGKTNYEAFVTMAMGMHAKTNEVLRRQESRVFIPPDNDESNGEEGDGNSEEDDPLYSEIAEVVRREDQPSSDEDESYVEVGKWTKFDNQFAYAFRKLRMPSLDDNPREPVAGNGSGSPQLQPPSFSSAQNSPVSASSTSLNSMMPFNQGLFPEAYPKSQTTESMTVSDGSTSTAPASNSPTQHGPTRRQHSFEDHPLIRLPAPPPPRSNTSLRGTPPAPHRRLSGSSTAGSVGSRTPPLTLVHRRSSAGGASPSSITSSGTPPFTGSRITDMASSPARVSPSSRLTDASPDNDPYCIFMRPNAEEIRASSEAYNEPETEEGGYMRLFSKAPEPDERKTITPAAGIRAVIAAATVAVPVVARPAAEEEEAEAAEAVVAEASTDSDLEDLTCC